MYRLTDSWTAYQRLPQEGRYMRPTGAASGADDSRVISPALGWRPLGLHPKPDQTFDINHKHVILELAGIIHPSKDEQAVVRQHSAAVASACWQWFACLPCMAPHNFSALAFIDQLMVTRLPQWSGMCCPEYLMRRSYFGSWHASCSMKGCVYDLL